jgi:type I restriction enzyme S subunit
MKEKGKKRGTKAAAEPSLFPVEENALSGDENGAPPVIERWKIPDSWTWAKVGDVGEVKKGMVRTPRNRPGINATKYLRAANITEDGLDLTSLFEMDFDAEDREVFRLRRGDIVLSEASGSPQQVGKSALWNEELPVCCFQNTVLRFRSMGVSSEFALIVYRHYAENGLFASLVRGVGIGHLGSERFGLFPFPLPPRNEQDRIVVEFAAQAERVRTALASLHSAKGKMALQRQAIVQAELGLNEEAAFGSKSKLPSGWSRVRLGDICEAVNGRAFKTSEWAEKGLPIIRIQNLRDRNTAFNYFGGKVEERHIVNEGDLLFAWSGTPGTSFGAFVWQGPRGALNQHIFKLSPDQSRVNGEFLYYAINQNLEDYVAAAQGGGGLAHLTRSQILDSEVILAPLEDQDRIVKAIKSHWVAVDQQEAIVEQNIRRTQTLRQALLVQAVGGKLVAQDAKDDSSAEHLADIQAELARYEEELKGRRKALKGTVMAKRTSGETARKRDMHDVLVELGPLSVQELFKKAGYRAEKPDEVEVFYRLLDNAMKSKRVAAEPGDDPECTRLKAVRA